MAIKNKIDFVCDQVINQKVFEGKYKEIIHSINEKIKTNEISSQKNLGFLHVKKNIQKSDYSKLQNILKFFNEEKIEVLVVIAPEYICLQSESIINLVDTHLKEDSDIDILFINESYSGIDVANLIKYLENKRFALNVISKNGDDFESLIIFRELISLLTNRVGRNNATKYIYVTTNNNYGRLFNW
ncbi:Glucose-6-phosphate isomerase, partial [Metamycoplasma alkalescens]